MRHDDQATVPARLYRYVDSLPDDVMCRFDAKDNLLVINRAVFDELLPSQQHDIMRNPRTIVIPASK
jgi:hypothetical protein